MNTPRGHQPATSGGLRAALHSYLHVAPHPKVHPYFKLAHGGRAAHAAGGGGPWNVPDLCHAYNWPTGLIGGGVIAIVELGGGWVQSDMTQFFGGIGQPVPNITDVSVDGTQNTPDPSPNSADGEVALDIEVAAAAYYVATGKAATIRVYWAQDIASAVRAATADNCDVCSISWGADEANWGAQAGQDMEEAAIEATTAGMIVFAASGDNDSSDGGPGRANVDLPASAPHVIGCGGTSKTRTHETVCDTKLVVARNRWFESISLQQGVTRELDSTAACASRSTYTAVAGSSRTAIPIGCGGVVGHQFRAKCGNDVQVACFTFAAKRAARVSMSPPDTLGTTR